MENIFDWQNLFDSHCHLTAEIFDDNLAGVVKDAVDAGVDKMIDIGTDIETSEKALKHSQIFPGVVYAAAGIDPEVLVPGSDLYNPDFDIDDGIGRLRGLLKSEASSRFVMLGECGMDLYWLRKNNVEEKIFKQSKDGQMELFEAQVNLAKEFGLPLSVHHRDSLDECLEIVEQVGGVTGIMHSFVGSYDDAKKIFDHGFKIGINGIVTYRSAEGLRETVRKIIGRKKIEKPRDLYNLGIYLETDAPFLPVTRSKQKTSEPFQIKLIDEAILLDDPHRYVEVP